LSPVFQYFIDITEAYAGKPLCSEFSIQGNWYNLSSRYLDGPGFPTDPPKTPMTLSVRLQN